MLNKIKKMIKFNQNNHDNNLLFERDQKSLIEILDKSTSSDYLITGQGGSAKLPLLRHLIYYFYQKSNTRFLCLDENKVEFLKFKNVDKFTVMSNLNETYINEQLELCKKQNLKLVVIINNYDSYNEDENKLFKMLIDLAKLNKIVLILYSDTLSLSRKDFHLYKSISNKLICKQINAELSMSLINQSGAEDLHVSECICYFKLKDKLNQEFIEYRKCQIQYLSENELIKNIIKSQN